MLALVSRRSGVVRHRPLSMGPNSSFLRPPTMRPFHVRSRASQRVERPRAVRKPTMRLGGMSRKRMAGWAAAVISIGGAGFAFYWAQNAGFTIEDMQEAIRRRLSRFDSHVDPTQEMFAPASLGAPPVDTRLQDGSAGEPIVTIVMQLEGVLFKKEFDYRTGPKYMKRPHLETFFKMVHKHSKNHFHVWFWSEDSVERANMVLETLFTKQGSGLGVTSMQQLFPALLGKEHKFLLEETESTRNIRLQQEERKKQQQQNSKPLWDRLFSDVTGPPLVKRLQPLPRHLPSVLLVDYDPQSYYANPQNTIIVPEFDEYNERDTALMTVIGFLMLYRELYRQRKVKTVSETVAWLKRRHPQIDRDPTSMSQFIQAEARDVLQQQARVEQDRLGHTMQPIKDSTMIGQGKAVTPGSTRYTKVVPGSLVDQKIRRMKEMQALMSGRAPPESEDGSSKEQ